MENDNNTTGEKHCPLCDKPVRSDANAETLCALCGMAIYDDDPEATSIVVGGKRLDFCCPICEDMYVTVWDERPTRTAHCCAREWRAAPGIQAST